MKTLFVICLHFPLSLPPFPRVSFHHLSSVPSPFLSFSFTYQCPLISSVLSPLPASLTPFSFLSFPPFLQPLSQLNFFIHLPLTSCASFSLPSSVFPRPDWWCVEVRQMDGGWGIAPASLWHWGPFRPGKWSMLNLILNTLSLTPADRRRVEASVWQHSWGNLIRPTVQVYLQVCLCACVWLCVLPSYLKQLIWHRSHLSCT